MRIVRNLAILSALVLALLAASIAPTAQVGTTTDQCWDEGWNGEQLFSTCNPTATAAGTVADQCWDEAWNGDRLFSACNPEVG